MVFVFLYVLILYCLHSRYSSVSDVGSSPSAGQAGAPSAPPAFSCSHQLYEFPEPQPVYLKNGDFLAPSADGAVELLPGDELTISCGDAGSILNANALYPQSTARLRCVSGNLWHNESWLSEPSPVDGFRCLDPPSYSTRWTGRTCYGGHELIGVGYLVDGAFHPLYESCFDEASLTVLYSKYEQRPRNAHFQTGGERPFFQSDGHYGSVPVESIYYQNGLRAALAGAVGHQAAGRYFNKNEFLSRGHLAARTDFSLAFAQRATFHYLNCAPQWYGFNSGNWNTLEVNLRQRIGRAGLNTVIYTGSFGVAQLRDHNERFADLYLHRDRNNNRVLPVPLYYYKVVHEPSLELATAFVGINNPYCTREEARALTFCEDICRDRAFGWLGWSPDNATEGFSFCCRLSEFRRTVPHLPPFEVQGLLV